MLSRSPSPSTSSHTPPLTPTIATAAAARTDYNNRHRRSHRLQVLPLAPTSAAVACPDFGRRHSHESSWVRSRTLTMKLSRGSMSMLVSGPYQRRKGWDVARFLLGLDQTNRPWWIEPFFWWTNVFRSKKPFSELGQAETTEVLVGYTYVGIGDMYCCSCNQIKSLPLLH
jgi:hypothetical protein